jgi:hypothetical protein
VEGQWPHTKNEERMGREEQGAKKKKKTKRRQGVKDLN